MKKNKKSTYILLVVLIIVWGAILTQLFDGFFTEPTFSINNQIIESKVTKPVNNLDSLKLYLNYNDPFGLTKTNRSNRDSRKRPEEKFQSKFNKSTTAKAPEIKWPSLFYSGFIESSNKETIGLLKINEKSILVRKDDIIDSLEIIQLTKDSIIVKYMNTTKPIKKK